MHVKLPEGRDYSGEEIVRAFKRAATFEESSLKRMKASEWDREIQYEAGSVKETIRKMGVLAQPQKIGKRWILWGERVWWDDTTSDKNLGFLLQPLLYQERHKEVEVSVRIGPCGNFDKARPYFRAFLQRFFAELQKPQAATA